VVGNDLKGEFGNIWCLGHSSFNSTGFDAPDVSSR
jgi:hypothetical protein